MYSQLEWIVRSENYDFAELSTKQLVEKRICSVHFLPSDKHIFTSGKMTLISTAVPINVNDNNNVNTEIADNFRDEIEELIPQTLDSFNQNISLASETVITKENISTPKNVLTHRVRRFTLCTVKEKRLKSQIRNLRRQLILKNRKIRKINAINSQRKISMHDVLHYIAKNLNQDQLLFIKMQLNHIKKRKWMQDEKEFALALYYASPKAYIFLRNKKKFALPSITLIREWINDLQLKPGINPQIMHKIAMKAENMNNFEKECVLMWDEMSIKTILQFNSKDDLVEGYQDLGDLGRTNNFAKHALCFLLRDLKSSWKQPIAYFTSHGNVHGRDLNIILTKIESILKTGLTLKSKVCDQGPTKSYWIFKYTRRTSIFRVRRP